MRQRLRFRVALPNRAVCVCTENPIRIDLMAESPNIAGNGRAVKLPAGAIRLTVQVEVPA